MNIEIIAVPAFQDNYIWLIVNQDTKHCIAVDPGDASPVIETIQQLSLLPMGIFITHHHFDHTHGVKKLLAMHPKLHVFGPKNESIYGINFAIDKEGEYQFHAMQLPFSILKTPGHTLDHICFYLRQKNALFCGDTLFSAGCGRLFEGTAEQMQHSLNKINALPAETLIYCAHEYTLQNLAFAQTVEPNNHEIKTRIASVQARRDAGQASLPSTLSIERKTNPFLRAKEPPIIASVNRQFPPLKETLNTFTLLRQWKDKF